MNKGFPAGLEGGVAFAQELHEVSVARKGFSYEGFLLKFCSPPVFELQRTSPMFAVHRLTPTRSDAS